MRLWGVTTVRIATYNLQNLFLADEDRLEVNPPGKNTLTPQKRLRPMARMIAQVEADLLLVQEVGSQTSLEQLNALLSTPYPYCAVVPGNSVRSIHLGVMSRFPVQITSHRTLQLLDDSGAPLLFYPSAQQAAADEAQAAGFFRDLLQIEIQASSELPMTFFAVHLKSKTNPPWQLHSASIYRHAEARALRRVVEAYRLVHPANGVGVLGDFNDLLSSDALQPLRELPLQDVVGAQLRQAGRNPSTYWPRRRMRIDHILLDARLAALVAPGSAVIHANNMARTASDHYPVSVVIEPELSTETPPI